VHGFVDSVVEVSLVVRIEVVGLDSVELDVVLSGAVDDASELVSDVRMEVEAVVVP
jgi:hypothetical protein